MNNQPQTELFPGLDFGQALKALRNGSSIARNGWEGKGLSVRLGPAAYAIHFVIIRGQGWPNTWVPSVSDCFADDWYIVT